MTPNPATDNPTAEQAIPETHDYCATATSILPDIDGYGPTKAAALESALRKWLKAASAHLGRPVRRGEYWPAAFYQYRWSEAMREWRLLGSVPGDPKWRS